MERYMGQRHPVCLQVTPDKFISSLMPNMKIFYTYRDVDESLIMVSANGGSGRVIVPGNIMRDPRVFRFKLSPDQKYVMLAFRPQR